MNRTSVADVESPRAGESLIIRPLVAVAAFLLFLAVFAGTSSASLSEVAMPLADLGEFVPGELLVAIGPGGTQASAEAARRVPGAVQIQSFPELGIQVWKLPSSLPVPDAIRALAAYPAIRFAEPNYLWRATAIPSDALRNELWGLHNLGQTGGTADADIDALEAWDVQTGSRTVVVGVIDTGIDYLHEDLQGNIWTNPGEDLNANDFVDPTDFNGLDDDGNGKVDDLRGWDCRNEDNDPMDDNNHGTHVAGTIGARGDNGIGVVGVNWNVKLMPLKFLGAGGSGSTTDAIECINYAASFVDSAGNKIVRITSNSWGGGSKSRALEQAIASSGALFVAAAGNSGSSSKMYPAGHSLENILAVAATDHLDNLASFSNYGSDWVDVGAPGVNVLSSVRNNGYRTFSGTSMATPHVSGVAALVLAQSPGMTNAQLKATIMNTVDLLPSLQGKTVTGGRLNAARAIGVPEFPADSEPPAAVGDLSIDSGQTTQTTLALAWTSPGDDGPIGTAYLYDIRYLANEPISDANWDAATKASNEPIPKPSGSLESFTLTRLSPGTEYQVALKVADEAGGFSALSNVATGTTAPSPWEIRAVDGQAFGGDSSLAYDPLGNPAVAYLDDTSGDGWGDALIYAHWNGASWDMDVVEVASFGGSAGIDLAYDPADGNPSLSYFVYDGTMWAVGTLRFAHRSGNSWAIQDVDRRVFTNSETSLAYNPQDGFPAISYARFPRGGHELRLARWTGSSWNVQVVTQDTARWHSLAFDLGGNPSLAYSHDLDGDGYLDTLKFARWDGTSWNFQIVETGVVGYGVMPDLAYNPVSGWPAIVHSYQGVRFTQWDGIAWTVQAAESGDRASLAFDAVGVPSLAYGSSGDVRYARWDQTSWQSEVVEGGFLIGGQTHLRFDLSGRPSLAYAGSSADGAFRGVKFAVRA